MNAVRPIFAVVSKKGFIALTSVLIISAVAVLLAVSVAILGITNANSALDYKKGEETLKIAQGCAEEALLRLRADLNWDPNQTQVALPGTNGSCWVDVSGSGNNLTIDIKASITTPHLYERYLQLQIKRVGYAVNLLSWQETSSFAEAAPSPSPGTSPSPSPSPTSPTTCAQYCQGLTYSNGTCRANSNQCTVNGETYESGGDIYCTGGFSADSCCCNP